MSATHHLKILPPYFKAVALKLEKMTGDFEKETACVCMNGKTVFLLGNRWMF